MRKLAQVVILLLTIGTAAMALVFSAGVVAENFVASADPAKFNQTFRYAICGMAGIGFSVIIFTSLVLPMFRNIFFGNRN